MAFSSSNSSQNSEINVTPLIDVLLVLLIIFMILVPVSPSGLKALSPAPAKPSSTEPDPSTVVLELRSGSEGQTFYSLNQQPIPKQELEARLGAIFALRQRKVMFVKGDRDLEFSRVAEAISIAHAALVTDIGILTQRMEEGK